MRSSRGLITAAILIAGIRMWMQVRGKTKTPFDQWAVGWGALFLVLSMLGEVYPQGANTLAAIVVVSDFLVNGASLFEDVSSLTTGAEKGQILSPQPFANTSVQTSNRQGITGGSPGSSQRVAH